MDKRIRLSLAAVVLGIAAAAPALAQGPGGFYLGGGAGWTNVSVEDDDYYYDCCYDYYHSYDSGEEDAGFAAHVGYRFGPYFAAELGYLNGGNETCPKPHSAEELLKHGREKANGEMVIVPEVYSRIVGYFRPVENWNKGKKKEFSFRKPLKVMV